MSKPRVLFLCSGNSARSQMAEAFLRAYAGDHVDAYSAGLEPTEIHPLTVCVMQERGFDLTGHRAKGLDECRTPRNSPGRPPTNSSPGLVRLLLSFPTSFDKLFAPSGPPAGPVALPFHVHVEACIDESVEDALRHHRVGEELIPVFG